MHEGVFKNTEEYLNHIKQGSIKSSYRIDSGKKIQINIGKKSEETIEYTVNGEDIKSGGKNLDDILKAK